MGNVTSRADEAAALYLSDQSRLAISSLVVSSPKKRSSVNIVPNSFPAIRVAASRPLGEYAPVDFIQDPEPSQAGSAPSFLLKLANDDDLVFNFTFVLRQSAGAAPTSGDTVATAGDTQINGLTFVYASTPKDIENLVTREFHADPNIHKNPRVELVGEYSTGGSPSVSFEWSWKWKPPRPLEDKEPGWRNCCSFVEYNPRTHKFYTLASFSYWVSNTTHPLSQPNSPSPVFTLNPPPPKIRVGSAQSVESRLTSAEEEPPSPASVANESVMTLVPPPTSSKDAVKVDLACPRLEDDVTSTEDGPVFRATIKSLEQKTGNMRTKIKKVLKKAEQAREAQIEANDAFSGFMEALREASSTNANAVQPAIDHYFDKIAREILSYEKQNAANLQRMIIDPLNRLYQSDIKQADSKKRDFEEESKDYYAYVARYLGQRHDSVKTKKLAESDSKYQTKRRNFELKRFDYSSFMQDLHGGRKEQEVLSHLTKYATSQTKGFLATAKKVDSMLPQLEALSSEVQGADKDYQMRREVREEKRRHLEKGSGTYTEPDAVPVAPVSISNGNQTHQSHSDSELGRADSTGSRLHGTASGATSSSAAGIGDLSRSPGSLNYGPVGSPAQSSKFKGIRDLEEKDTLQLAEKNSTQRKEGLLWALSRTGSHVDPRNVTKQGWHKFWIVLDQGKLSEYSNWKQKLDLHMDPIDLRVASVREARNAERRFCFEVITPHYKRVYQATSEEDMNNWITSINNALQSAMEGHGLKEKPETLPSPTEPTTFKRDIGSILTGKVHSSGYSSHSPSSSSSVPSRRTTVGARPGNTRAGGLYDDNPDKLLQSVRNNDQGNCWCADCGSGTKVEWVSINLGIILCIECSGIHRSLGTHISKIRSLTLDITSFTPDIVEILLLVGNRISNMVWEAKVDPSQKPGPQATRDQRLKFITAKYVDRAYVEPLSPTQSHFATADDTLLTAIKKNDIQQVLYALALRANPNVADKSRGTHPVFLALAASDPASPSPSPAAGQPAEDSKVIPFPVAEMLLQNGAELPSTMPAFPLSRHAQQYVEQKRTRGIPAPSNSTSQTPAQRDKEQRMQKRVSAGGKLAKSPIPERF